MPIDYDASPTALFHPHLSDSVFASGGVLTSEQIGAEAARLAYVRFETSASEKMRLQQSLALADFTKVGTFHSPLDAQAFAAYREQDGTAVVAFRGTEVDALKDYLTNAILLLAPWDGPGLVHSGFNNAWESIRHDVQAWLDAEAPDRQHLITCGHSLGGALAALASQHLAANLLVTLGGPRIGDPVFAASFPGDRVRRFLNCCDVVPELPPPIGYSHLPALEYIDSKGRRTAGLGKLGVRSDQIQGALEYRAKHPLPDPQVLPLRGLADHAPINYIRALFNP